MLAELFELLFGARRRIDDDIGEILGRIYNDLMQHIGRGKNRHIGFDEKRLAIHIHRPLPGKDVPAMFHIVLVFITLHPGVHGIDEQGKMLCPAGFFIYKDPKCSRPAV
ncbi:MAG: hypothetical protein QT01_C0010G0002 [archaeon GW2011_AR6]|nr:MAG: hypothetical protein QT01_C0010G0002 [archaeon GW2011_AR6]